MPDHHDIDAPASAGEWHVASLVVRHRPEALERLAAVVGGAPGLELALHDDTCSVLLQECGGTAELMSSVDMLQALAGVLSVNLVFHHVEPSPVQGATGVAAPPSGQEHQA